MRIWNFKSLTGYQSGFISAQESNALNRKWNVSLPTSAISVLLLVPTSISVAHLVLVSAEVISELGVVLMGCRLPSPNPKLTSLYLESWLQASASNTLCPRHDQPYVILRPLLHLLQSDFNLLWPLQRPSQPDFYASLSAPVLSSSLRPLLSVRSLLSLLLLAGSTLRLFLSWISASSWN